MSGVDGAKGKDELDGKRGPGRSGVLSRLRTYFFAGILVTAPVGITFWLAWKVIGFIDNQVTPLVPPQWNPETYLPFSIPGLGL
ncbi:MAG: hypothetical protein IH900_06835, partial [Proteobacteria bacterium]|nr:hypothetical protein [Pseudomonadota bacterium]